MSTVVGNGIGNVRGIPPVEPGKFLKAGISGPYWDTITADDVSGLSTTVLQTWRFTTNKTDAATTGRLGLNAATWDAVTQININEMTFTGVDWSNIFANAHVGDNLVVQDASDSTKVGRYTITGDPVDNGTWRAFPVVCDDSSGVIPSNNADVRVAFTYYNTSGGTGSGGGIPQPVVNGQWIKGVGGAAVWQPIFVADVSGAEATVHKDQVNGYVGITPSGGIILDKVAAGTPAIQTGVLGDTVIPFWVGARGKLQWGDGTNALDTNLYRVAAGYVGTDYNFQANGLIVAAAGTSQITLHTNGSIYFGNAFDTYLTRIAAGAFGTNSGIYVQAAPLGVGFSYNPAAFNSNNIAFQATVSGENQRFVIGHDGKIFWGPGGAVTPDTNLYRSAAGKLRSDGTIDANALTVNGVPVGGGMNLDYLGAYDPAVTYNDGDFVIGADGVTYVCVVDGTIGVAPTAWASGQWGIPQPVVNGQFIKGSGGAAVWTAISDADVPAIASGGRLYANGSAMPGANYNNATADGFYYGIPTDANCPPNATYYAVQVYNITSTGNVRQIAYAYPNDNVYMRRQQDGGAWGPWICLHPKEVAIAQLSGTITYSGSGTQVLGALPSSYYTGQRVELFATFGIASTGAGAQTPAFWWGENGNPITNVHFHWVPGGGGPSIIEIPLRHRLTPAAGNHAYQLLWSASGCVCDAANYTTPILTATYV